MLLKGKLTYTSIAVAALAAVGIQVTGAERETLYGAGLVLAEAAGIVGAIYGRWRANRA